MSYFKTIDAVIQDSKSPHYVVKFSNVVATTSTTALAVRNAYTINVTSATGFVVGQYLTIYNVASNRVYFSYIKVISTLTITLDRPLDFAFPSGSVVTVGITNMNVNGSVTPQIFGIRNPAGSDIPLAIDITRLMFSGLTTSTPTLAQFGNIAALARGIQVRKVDGEWHNIFNAKTNAELKNIMYDFEIQNAASQAQDGFTGRFTLTNLGAVIRLGANEDLQIAIQDEQKLLLNISQLKNIVKA